ncbi:MAG: transposase [candidate division Zixibacteria bacterium]|nr:transposase [candidate division Zixibacteria bacterium]
MRGTDNDQQAMFSYVSLESRVPDDHPLRSIRRMVDRILAGLSGELTLMYSHTGRPSIAPERLLRALLLQVLYTIRSERMLMEQLDYNMLFRWFVGLSMDDMVWDHSTFTKNRDRFLESDLAGAFSSAVVSQAEEAGLLSDEHFTVDGTSILDPKEHPTPNAEEYPGVNIRFAGRGPGSGGLHIDRFFGATPDGGPQFRFHWDLYASASLTSVTDALQNIGTALQHPLFESLGHSIKPYYPVQIGWHWMYQNQATTRGHERAF